MKGRLFEPKSLKPDSVSRKKESSSVGLEVQPSGGELAPSQRIHVLRERKFEVVSCQEPVCDATEAVGRTSQTSAIHWKNTLKNEQSKGKTPNDQHLRKNANPLVLQI